jgi:hypothetical protein
MKNALKSIFISWDFIVAVSVAIFLYFFLPSLIPAKTIRPIYEVSISVLSVIFSVFFAALAVLITAGDNEFVRFLEEEGLYKRIIFTFKVTLILLFIALIFSIFSFVTILPYTETEAQFVYAKQMVVLFAFITLYALLASINSTMDAIKYAEFRAAYLEITKDNKN